MEKTREGSTREECFQLVWIDQKRGAREQAENRGPVAQLVEQRFALREVVSSTLAGPRLRALK